MPRHQLDIQRRGDQLIVMAGHILRAAQPVAHATGAEADHTEAGQTGQYLPAGKCHPHPQRHSICDIFSLSRQGDESQIAAGAYDKGSLRCPCGGSTVKRDYSHSMVAGGLLDTS